MELYSDEYLDNFVKSLVSNDESWIRYYNDNRFLRGKYQRLLKEQVLFLNSQKGSKSLKSVTLIGEELSSRGIIWKLKNDEFDVELGENLFNISFKKGIKIRFTRSGRFYSDQGYVNCTASEKDIVDFIVFFSKLHGRIGAEVPLGKKLIEIREKQAQTLADIEFIVFEQKVKECMDGLNINYTINNNSSGFQLMVQVADDIWVYGLVSPSIDEESLRHIPRLIEHLRYIVPYINLDFGRAGIRKF